MIPTTENKQYAQFVAKAIGRNPSVFPYYDNDKTNSIDMLSLEDPLDSNIAIYSTIGLSDFPNEIEMNDNQKRNIPVELVMTGYKEYDNVPNILASCSFYILKNNWTCQPGTVFKEMVSDYYSGSMKHILFIRPYLWEEKLTGLKFGNKTIHCLLCIPISDEEFEFKQKNGQANLEHLLFGEKDIDISDIQRRSIL